MGDTTALQIQSGIGELGLIEGVLTGDHGITGCITDNILLIGIFEIYAIPILLGIIAIATSVETAYHQHRLVSRHLCATYGDGSLRTARAGGNSYWLTDGSRDVISAIDFRNKNVGSALLTIDKDGSRAFDISHTGSAIDCIDIAGTHGDRGTTTRVTLISAAIDITTDGNRGILGMNQRCHDHQHQEEQQAETVSYARTYYNIIYLQYQCSIFN